MHRYGVLMKGLPEPIVRTVTCAMPEYQIPCAMLVMMILVSMMLRTHLGASYLSGKCFNALQPGRHVSTDARQAASWR